MREKGRETEGERERERAASNYVINHSYRNLQCLGRRFESRQCWWLYRRGRCLYLYGASEIAKKWKYSRSLHFAQLSVSWCAFRRRNATT